MVLYKATIKPLGSFASPLQGDTFFGAFCWSYKYLFGEESLVALLQQCLANGPQVVFSNAFPEGYLPLPMGVYDEARTRYGEVDKSEAKKAYQDNKKYKKCSLVKKEAFINIQNGICKGYSSSLAKDQFEQVETSHSVINRRTGIGDVYVTGEYFVNGDALYDLYILSEIPQDTLEKVVNLMFELGIGADKSLGKGGFKVVAFAEEKELCQVEKPSAFVALSNFIPSANDPTNGQYKTFVKYGKVDREYASGEYPFKKPLLYIQAGAVFKDEAPKSYYGSFIENVSAVDGVVVNACTIALPIKI